ncbi:MAG: HDOD domain-containing protein [Syntrophobacteraceae bacterium]
MRSEQLQQNPGRADAHLGTVAARAGAAKIVEATGDLPAMPHVAAQVMEKLSNPNATPRDIHQLIEKDQGLAARVLKVANSPYYGASRSISTLRDAILFMGFDSIKSVVLTAVMKGIFAETGLAEKLLWEHSIGCGVAARRIGTAVGHPGKEEVFLAGLMHDVGKAVLFVRLPDKMSDIMQEVYNTGATFSDAETSALGFTHSEVGQLMADKWRFSLNIEEAIAHHHQPSDSHIAAQFCHIVSLANSVCHKLEIGPTRKPDLDLASLDSVKALGLNPDSMLEILDEVENAVKGGEDTGK